MTKKRGARLSDGANEHYKKALSRFIQDVAPEQETDFVIPHERIVWRDAKGHFRKAPRPGRVPKGWKKQTIFQFTDVLGKPAKRPDDPERISARWIQYADPNAKRSTWKNADKVDFRKPLVAKIVEQRGDRKQPHTIEFLNFGKPKLWRKDDRKETRKFLVPEIFVGKKIEVRLEGKTVKEALGKFNWEVGSYGQRVVINSKVNYFHRDLDGDLINDKFNADLIEEWHSAPNLTVDTEDKETYGSILKNRYAMEIRKGFASRRVRFTQLDALVELYDQGAFADEEEFEELYALMESRDQAERVTVVLLITVEDIRKKSVTKKSKKKPS